jgi:hypothetical protein
MKYLRIAIVTVLVLALLGGGLFVVCSIMSLRDFSDAYASDWTATFVIEHLKSTDNSWPISWDELRDEFDRMAEPTHYAWTFSELQDRVDFRFDVTAEQVRDSDPPLVVFRLTSGMTVSFNGDPNLLIRDHLRTGQGGMASLRTSDQSLHNTRMN